MMKIIFFNFQKEEKLTKNLSDFLEEKFDSKYILRNKDINELIINKKFKKNNINVLGNTQPSGTGMNGKIYDVKGICPTISTNKGEGIKIKSATLKGFENVNEGDSFNFSLPNSKTRRGRVGKKVAQTIQAQNFQATLNKNIIRRLTPK